jgi:hypothetical protein
MPKQEQRAMSALARLTDLALAGATTSRERRSVIADRDIVSQALHHHDESNELVRVDLDDVRDVLLQHGTEGREAT